jgi:hypothetical protein
MTTARGRLQDATRLVSGLRVLSSSGAQRESGVVPGARATPDSFYRTDRARVRHASVAARMQTYLTFGRPRVTPLGDARRSGWEGQNF